MKYGETLVKSRWSRYGKKYHFKYRIDPVPFTGKTKGMFIFRKIKTKQEKTYNENCPYTRSKRKNKNLPDDWEDVRRSDIDDRCWKKKKKRKQWM